MGALNAANLSRDPLHRLPRSTVRDAHWPALPGTQSDHEEDACWRLSLLTLGHFQMACVYILTNETIPGLLKIGYTGGTAADRAAEISRGTGVPSPYTVHWFIETTTIDAAYAVEQSVHQALKRDRHNRAREFFTTSLPVAIDIIERTAYQHGAIATDLPVIARMLEEERQAAKRAAAQRAANEQAKKEAAELYQREAPQREAAEHAMRVQQEATAKHISRKKRVWWSAAAVVSCLPFLYSDYKRHEELAYQAKQQAEQAARTEAARIKQVEEAKARFESASRARALQVENAKKDCEVMTAQANPNRHSNGLSARSDGTDLNNNHNNLTYSSLAAVEAAYKQRDADAMLQAKAAMRAYQACAFYDFLTMK